MEQDAESNEIYEIDGESINITNGNFVMMYRQEKKAMVELGKKDPTALVLLNFLLLEMGTDNSLIVSETTMGELLEWSRRTVQNKVKVLHDLKFIDILKSGTSNIYVVNANIAWSTYANMRLYAKFRSNVLISKTEQEANIIKISNERTKRVYTEKKK